MTDLSLGHGWYTNSCPRDPEPPHLEQRCPAPRQTRSANARPSTFLTKAFPKLASERVCREARGHRLARASSAAFAQEHSPLPTRSSGGDELDSPSGLPRRATLLNSLQVLEADVFPRPAKTTGHGDNEICLFDRVNHRSSVYAQRTTKVSFLGGGPFASAAHWTLCRPFA